MSQTVSERKAVVPDRWRLGPAFVPKGRYTDAEFLDLELQRLFPATWLNACRVDEVEQVGQFVDFEIGGESIVVVRSEQGLRAYFNACRHRGTRLVRGQGRVGELRCPFHSWRWNLDGSLRYQADAANFDPRPAEDLCLPECRLGTWGGWVFVNIDGQAEPLEEYLAPIPGTAGRLQARGHAHRLVQVGRSCRPTGRRPSTPSSRAGTFRAPIPSSSGPTSAPPRPPWPSATPTAAPSTSCSGCTRATPTSFRYGPEGDSVKLRAAYRSDPEAVRRNVEYSLRELRALYLHTDLAAAEELVGTEGADGPDGNAIYQRLRRQHAEAAGIDYPVVTDAQLKAAMYDWHLFPNTVFLIDMACCLAYRARPNGRDPDSCIFDVQGLEVPSRDGIDTAAPQFFDDWRDGDVGAILTQDFSNMSEVTAGLHSRAYDGHHLNVAQEMTIWNYHRAIDGYLFAG